MGQPQRAHVERVHPGSAARRRADGELGGASPDVDDAHELGESVRSRHGTGERERPLLPVGQDPYGPPGGRAERRQQWHRIGRLATGRGDEDLCDVETVTLGPPGERRRDLGCLADLARAEPAAALDLRAQAEEGLCTIQRLDLPSTNGRDEQPRCVGADVDHGDTHRRQCGEPGGRSSRERGC